MRCPCREGTDIGDGDRDTVRQPRPIIFCAPAGFAARSVLTAAVIAFVLAGAARQRSIIEKLHDRAQAVQVGNLTMLADFSTRKARRADTRRLARPASCRSSTGSAPPVAGQRRIRSCASRQRSRLVNGQANCL
jgi:hypothetical protein